MLQTLLWHCKLHSTCHKSYKQLYIGLLDCLRCVATVITNLEQSVDAGVDVSGVVHCVVASMSRKEFIERQWIALLHERQVALVDHFLWNLEKDQRTNR